MRAMLTVSRPSIYGCIGERPACIWRACLAITSPASIEPEPNAIDTTGINTVRIYNPVKQSHDQDPDGEFIRAWVPELAACRAHSRTWRLTPLELADAQSVWGSIIPSPSSTTWRPRGPPASGLRGSQNRRIPGRGAPSWTARQPQERPASSARRRKPAKRDTQKTSF